MVSLPHTFTTYIWSGWHRKAFSLFAFIAVNVGCSCHWWTLGSESSGQSQQAKWNFKIIISRVGEEGRGKKGRRKTLGNFKKSSGNYNTPHVICVLNQKSKYFSIVFFLTLLHERGEWRLTAREDSSSQRLWPTDLWGTESGVKMYVFCWIRDHALWGSSDICVFLC